MKGISKMKTYDNLRKFLKRCNVENPSSVALLLFSKFVENEYPTRFHVIKADDLKEKNILPSKTHLTFASWRLEMKNKGILICMAAHEDFRDITANHKAGQFRFGPAIKKYIEAALHEKSSVFERLDTKVDQNDLEALERRMNERLELAATKEQLNDLKLKLDDVRGQMENALLFALPPDTETRRQIIRKYSHDKEKCIAMLKANAA